MSTSKKSRGRQRIEMKKMSNESNLQVTFSKRRGGLFNKASELCTLCGAEVALIVFSPGEKVFSFGHPNVQSIIDRYLLMHDAAAHNPGTMQFMEAQRTASVSELNEQLTRINGQLEAEKKRGEELSRLQEALMSQYWWALPVDQMGKTQLDQMKAALEELKKSTIYYAERLHMQGMVSNNPATQLLGMPSSSDVHHRPNSFPTPSTHQVPQLFASPILQPMTHNGENTIMHNPMFDWNMMHQQHGFNINTSMGRFGPMSGFF